MFFRLSIWGRTLHSRTSPVLLPRTQARKATHIERLQTSPGIQRILLANDLEIALVRSFVGNFLRKGREMERRNIRMREDSRSQSHPISSDPQRNIRNAFLQCPSGRRHHRLLSCQLLTSGDHSIAPPGTSPSWLNAKARKRVYGKGSQRILLTRLTATLRVPWPSAATSSSTPLPSPVAALLSLPVWMQRNASRSARFVAYLRPRHG